MIIVIKFELGDRLLNQSLAISDYENIIHFASTIAKPENNIRSVILHELANQFGYDKSIFWIADDLGNLTDPVVHGLSDQTIYDYVDEFSKHDFLHPQKHLSLFRSQKALRLVEIVRPKEYEDSVYYQAFMAPNGFYDEMVISLINEKQMIGVIGLARDKQSTFEPQDSKRFKLMSKVISATFLHQYQEDPSLLSEREADVVALVKEGKTNREIAEKLFITHNTVKKHLQNIYRKYHVQNKVQLVQKI